MRGSRKCSSTSSPTLRKRTQKSSPITSRRPTRSVAPSSISSSGAKLSAKRSGFVEAIAQLETALRLLAMQPRSRERIRLELGVYRTLGGINAEHRGFSSAECGSAYTTALALCRELGDAPESILGALGPGIVRDHARRLRNMPRARAGMPVARCRPAGEAADRHGAPAARRNAVSASGACGGARAPRGGAAPLRHRPGGESRQAGALRAGPEIHRALLSRADARR